MQVVCAEIQPIPSETVVGGHRKDSSALAVFDLHHVDVEVTVRVRGNIGQALAVRRPGGIDVDMVARGERGRSACLEVQDPQVDALAVIVRRIHEPLAVGGPFG